MTGLAMLVQQGLSADPFDGAVFAFRGRRAGLIMSRRYEVPDQAITQSSRQAGRDPSLTYAKAWRSSATGQS